MALEVELLRDSFKLLTPKAEQLATTFYELLFQRYPDVQPLFAGVRFDEQKKKLVRALALIVKNLEKPEYLRAYLGGLGQMHVAYGATPAFYPAVGECLLAALETTAGSRWNEELTKAWAEAYGAVVDLMLAGTGQSRH